MANIADVSTVIASALSEVSVNGTLDVEMDGATKILELGRLSGGEAVEVVVTVTPIPAN